MKRKNDVKPKEFRKNNARTGHPAYIVDIKIKKDKKQQSVSFLGLTSAPKTHDVKNIKLEKNPNPKDSSISYIRPKVEEVELTKKTFGKKLKGWKFSSNDKKIVNQIIKKNK